MITRLNNLEASFVGVTDHTWGSHTAKKVLAPNDTCANVDTNSPPSGSIAFFVFAHLVPCDMQTCMCISVCARDCQVLPNTL